MALKVGSLTLTEKQRVFNIVQMEASASSVGKNVEIYFLSFPLYKVTDIFCLFYFWINLKIVVTTFQSNLLVCLFMAGQRYNSIVCKLKFNSCWEKLFSLKY